MAGIKGTYYQYPSDLIIQQRAIKIFSSSWMTHEKKYFYLGCISKFSNPNFFYFSCLNGIYKCNSGLVSLAFAGSIGMTFVILACALPTFEKKWWPFFVVLFYVLSPIPTMIARRQTDATGGTNSPCMETAIFITMGFLVSSFGLPIVLARAGSIYWGACYLTLAGNIIVYLTILGFFTIFDLDDNDYAMW